jgi:hypothetical protein
VWQKSKAIQILGRLQLCANPQRCISNKRRRQFFIIVDKGWHFFVVVNEVGWGASKAKAAVLGKEGLESITAGIEYMGGTSSGIHIISEEDKNGMK